MRNAAVPNAAAIVMGLVLVASACSSPESDTATVPSTTISPRSPSAGVETLLAAGTLEVPAAESFGDPGFHQVFMVTATTPPDVSGQRLVLRLRDLGRPDKLCESDHPLSGCTTVDWSDFEDRPSVPPGGVFDNHLTVQLASGPRTFFLSEMGTLGGEPDPYSPG